MMKGFLIYCFDTWWRPLVYFIVTLVLFIASRYVHHAALSNISLVLLATGLLTLIASAIYLLTQKRWIQAIVTGLAFGGTVAAFVLYSIVTFVSSIIDGDHWADNITIPANIPLAYPIDMTSGYQRPDSILALVKGEPDFQLYNGPQPGMYEFDFWTGKIGEGTLYLKAFEITQSYALSKQTLAESTSIDVYHTTDKVERFGSTHSFTIYEGDWGKPYAARFEVWFKSALGGPERKLFAKNYVIQGWMH
jgi:hypothetical protein